MTESRSTPSVCEGTLALALVTMVALGGRAEAAESLRFEGLPPTYSVSDSVVAMTVADVDRDGRLDVALANRDYRVTGLLSDEPCGFRPALEFTVGSNSRPSAIAPGDWNGDGFVDLAAAKKRVRSVAIRYGDGTGNFSWNQDPDIDAEPNSMIAADLPSIAAPEVALRRDGGVRKRLVFYLQGVLEDAASPSDV